MGNTDDIILVRKQLEKLIDNPEDISESAPTFIDRLSEEEMSLKILKKTKIGFTLNSLRKATDDETVKKAAKSLLKKWQKLEDSNKSDDKDEPSLKKVTDVVTYKLSYEVVAPVPTRSKNNVLVFDGFPDFQPNLTPEEVLKLGSFGGTYFRPIYSSVTKQKHGNEVWEELPKEWLEGLRVKTQVASSIYDASKNKYGVKCGASLEEWENSGWMDKQDPYGWFQWFCRFYQGRRTEDDQRQIGRWSRCAGATGRWKGNLISKIVKAGCGWDNHGVSPVVRQTLQHWAYQLTEADFNKSKKKYIK